jgi:hypothetical protein
MGEALLWLADVTTKWISRRFLGLPTSLGMKKAPKGGSCVYTNRNLDLKMETLA